MTLVALCYLSHYDVCRIIMFVAYDIYRLMMFVTLWRLLRYDVCRIIMFDTIWHLSLIVFVTLLCLLHYYVCCTGGLLYYDVCHQLWHLSLIWFVAVSRNVAFILQQSFNKNGKLSFQESVNSVPVLLFD